MNAVVKTALLALLTCVAVHTSAQSLSALEQAAARESRSLRFTSAALKQCAALRAYVPQNRVETDVRKDAHGRVITMRSAHGVDMVLEYGTDTDKRPVAVTAMGRRIDVRNPAPEVRRAVESMKARAILYRQVQSICGVNPNPARFNLGDTNVACADCGFPWGDGDDGGGGGGDGGGWSGGDGGGGGGDGGGGGGGDVPTAWFEPAFWEDTWHPNYFSAANNTPPSPPPVCVPRCENVCDVASDVIQVGCGTIGAYVAIANPVAGVAVGASCALGAVVGKYRCKWYECPMVCEGRP